MLSWNEIYDRADGAAHLSPELKAKDYARHEIASLMIENGDPNPNEMEIPEDAMKEYCDRYSIRFHENGCIAGYALPQRIAHAIYDQIYTHHLRADLENTIALLCDDVDATDEDMDKMVNLYWKTTDCNVAYNAILENVVKQILNI